MRECVCSICYEKFYENDSNPNIHYSEPSTICSACKQFESSQEESWLQSEDGNYYQKKECVPVNGVRKRRIMKKDLYGKYTQG